jgi:hypothetical protein
MNPRNPITTCCSKCLCSPIVCKCKDPDIVCGTCNKSLNTCVCEPGYEHKRCNYCLQFNVLFQQPVTGLWVCDQCLSNKAIQYDLRKMEEQPQ